MIAIRVLSSADFTLLMNVADDVFDYPINETYAREFLDDPRHHIVVGLADGSSRSFRRDGDVPKVEVKNPRDAHLKLLPTYADKDIHDVTAYLVTLK